MATTTLDLENSPGGERRPFSVENARALLRYQRTNPRLGSTWHLPDDSAYQFTDDGHLSKKSAADSQSGDPAGSADGEQAG